MNESRKTERMDQQFPNLMKENFVDKTECLSQGKINAICWMSSIDSILESIINSIFDVIPDGCFVFAD